jgi:hypothetical protein
VFNEDVCTYIRTLGNVRTGKYQHSSFKFHTFVTPAAGG